MTTNQLIAAIIVPPLALICIAITIYLLKKDNAFLWRKLLDYCRTAPEESLPFTANQRARQQLPSNQTRRNQLLDQIGDYLEEMTAKVEAHHILRRDRLEDFRAAIERYNRTQKPAKAIEAAPANDPLTAASRTFNEIAQKDAEVQTLEMPILPIADVNKATNIELEKYLDDLHGYYAKLFYIEEQISKQLVEEAERTGILRVTLAPGERAAPPPQSTVTAGASGPIRF
jgi:hypothetical protein